MADCTTQNDCDNGPSKVKTRTCKFFQTKTGCKFGDECRFLHFEKSSSQLQNVLKEGAEFVSNKDKNWKPDNYDSERRNEPSVEERKVEENEDSSSDKKGVVCRFFQRKRGCLRGDKCPFAHVVVGESAQINNISASNTQSSRRSREKNAVKGKELTRPLNDKEQNDGKVTALTSTSKQLQICDQEPTEQSDIQKENAASTIVCQGSEVTVLSSNKSTQLYVEDAYCKKVHTNEGAPSNQGNTVAVNATSNCRVIGDNTVNHVKSERLNEFSKNKNGTKSKENDKRVHLKKTSKEIQGTEGSTGILLQQDIRTKSSESKHGNPVPNDCNEEKHRQGLPLSEKNSQMTVVVTRIGGIFPNKENERKCPGTKGRTSTHNKDSESHFRGSYTLADAMLSERKKLRATEIQQLKRRFGGKDGFNEMKENLSYKIKFKPTDPDWPFKIEAIDLALYFPDDYPLHIFNVALSEEQDFPEDIINFVNQGLKQWTSEQEQMARSQGILKLFFRPFLRWFDKNLVSFFTEGENQMRAKYVSRITGNDDSACGVQSDSWLVSEGQNSTTAFTPSDQEHVQTYSHSAHWIDTGIDSEFIKPMQINATSDRSHVMIKEDSKGLDILCSGTYTENSCCNSLETCCNTISAAMNGSADGSPVPNNEMINIDESCDSDILVADHTNEQASRTSQSHVHSDDTIALNPVERGTQIQFKGLNLDESISSIRGNKIVITFECNRCRQRIDLQLSPSGCTVSQCTRCASVFAVTYRPAVVHQFSSTLGYLDLDRCNPFDVVLPESELMLGCFHCSKETSVKGLQYGANWSWCRHCHQKLRFQIQSTRFNQLQSNVLNTAVSLSKNIVAGTSSKFRKQSQSLGLKEGQPLPANGTCKHYKKSFRWLRFPCCGKCYPCDVCHEEEESHEMKFATRMVCGFCSKEQPYSQQPCSGCKASVTKTRSAHWEGGKGCRDKVSMSRNDDQKYRQLGKTTSRKAQKRSEGKGKAHKGK